MWLRGLAKVYGFPFSSTKVQIIRRMIPPHYPGPTHDLARIPLPLDLRGIISYPRGSLSPLLKILGIIPKRQIYKRALRGIYLERGSVHACILLCTRGYTVVYTRVHSSLLGRRDTLGFSHYSDFMRQPCRTTPLTTPPEILGYTCIHSFSAYKFSFYRVIDVLV